MTGENLCSSVGKVGALPDSKKAAVSLRAPLAPGAVCLTDVVQMVLGPESAIQGRMKECSCVGRQGSTHLASGHGVTPFQTLEPWPVLDTIYHPIMPGQLEAKLYFLDGSVSEVQVSELVMERTIPRTPRDAHLGHAAHQHRCWPCLDSPISRHNFI